MKNPRKRLLAGVVLLFVVLGYQLFMALRSTFTGFALSHS